MKSSCRLLSLLIAVSLAVDAVAREEVITTPDGRSIALTVPDDLHLQAVEHDFTFAVEISDAERTVSLQLAFPQLSPARYNTEERQKSLLEEMSRDDIEQSVEQRLNFKNFTSGSASGLFIVLTDGNLINRTPPPGQFLKLTRGLITTPSLVVFTIFSQSETSAAYRAAMAILRSGLEER